MSTFDGIVREFPLIRIDNFFLRVDSPPPLACFLSHVHSDHLKGLESFKSTFIYCTAQTRELLLRLEKYPHRMNFAKGILESRKQTYRRLKNRIKPIPLETPTVIELAPGVSIRVTLFDANHCLGACMFLIEGDGRAILYTGDIRSEQWWVNSLARNPVLVPYTRGARRLDNIYLDTTFTMDEALEYEFPSKAEGLSELLNKVSEYPADTIFYLNTWTFGYEEVWVALSAALNTRVHLDNYRWRLYHSQRDEPTCFGPQTASLVGFKLGNHEHPGCLTNSLEAVRIHSCEKGTRCEVFQNPNVVRITPIIARHKGHEISEIGAGGGHGDLDQTHSLELYDKVEIGQLAEICAKKLQGQPDLQAKVIKWFSVLMDSGRDAIKLDLEALGAEDSQDSDSADDYDLPIDRLIQALTKMVSGRNTNNNNLQQNQHITFPYSRHSSYQELRELVEAFRPRDIFPCTVDLSRFSSDISMEILFGDLCSAKTFQADKDIFALLGRTKTDLQMEGESQIHHTPVRPSTEGPAQTNANNHDPGSQTPKQATTSVTDRPDDIHQTDAATLETPGKRVRLSVSDGGTPSSALKSLRKKRAWNAALGLGGQTWDGLMSVSGYHNQQSEKEL